MESTKPKRISVAERFRKQMDLLTGDKKPIPWNLHFPLISLPFELLTKSQIMSLYDQDFVFVRPPEPTFHPPR